VSSPTRIEVSDAGVRLSSGSLAARRLPDAGGRVRVALVATEALLLAGDAVRVDVWVRGGRALEIVETSGTVAYHMRGGSASWSASLDVSDGCSVVWLGLPFVVATGADVLRSTHVRLAGSGWCALRETHVLGRVGQEGGRLLASTSAHLDGRPLLVETLELSPRTRGDFALLGGARCLDQLTLLGRRSENPAALQLELPGSILRSRTTHAHESQLEALITSTPLQRL
jgi:urease accessory protein